MIKEHVVKTVVGQAGVMTQDTRPFFMQKKPLLVVYFDLDLKVRNCCIVLRLL